MPALRVLALWAQGGEADGEGEEMTEAANGIRETGHGKSQAQALAERMVYATKTGIGIGSPSGHVGTAISVPEGVDAEEIRSRWVDYIASAIEWVTPQAAPDRNVEAVVQRLRERSRAGLAKYGVTTERGDLTLAQWLQHLQEELLDAAIYVEVVRGKVGDLERRELAIVEFARMFPEKMGTFGVVPKTDLVGGAV